MVNGCVWRQWLIAWVAGCLVLWLFVAVGGYGWVGSVVVIWKLWVCDVVLAGGCGWQCGDFGFVGCGGCGFAGLGKKRDVSLFMVILSSEKKRETEKREIKEYKKIIKK